MDATGNECSDATTVGTFVSSDGAKFPSAHSPKVATNKAASYSGSAVKRTAPTRHTSERSKVNMAEVAKEAPFEEVAIRNAA
jgi:hypothetical protein